MSDKSSQIQELLNAGSAAAPDVTKPLKTIGDGNMLEGVKNVFAYGEKSGLYKGEIRGSIKGSIITLGVCGIAYGISKGVKLVRNRIAEKKAHDEMGEKIYAAFSEAEETCVEGTADEENIEA